MTPFEWVALIGAGAWLPHLGVWLYRFLVKPTLRLKVGPAEVGFNSLGPVLTFDCAFSVHRKDAVIESMELAIKHEKGQQIALQWKTLFETFSQVTTQSGESAEYSKQSPALILKVGTSNFVALRVSFQDLAMAEARSRLVSALLDEDNRLRKLPGYVADHSVQSKQFDDFVKHYASEFPWQEGRYEVSVKTTLYGVKEPTTTELEFSLIGDDIERLKANLPNIESNLTDILTEADPAKRPVRSWNWANPQLVERS